MIILYRVYIRSNLLRWPRSVTVISASSQQFQLHSRQCQVHHGNFNFTHGNFNFIFKAISILQPRQILFQFHHGNFNFGFARDNFQTGIMINKYKLAIRKRTVNWHRWNYIHKQDFIQPGIKKSKIQKNTLQQGSFRGKAFCKQNPLNVITRFS